jgi:hypothetical protein
MSEPIFGKETYEKWFVAKPMTDAQRAEFERNRPQPAAYLREVMITHNSAWVVFNEVYPNSFAAIKPSSLTDRQIILAQRLMMELVEGRRALKVVSALAQSMLYKTPQSLTSFGLIIFNFVRKLPSDAFTSGMPSQASIAAIQENTWLKAYVANRMRAEVFAEFDSNVRL